MVEEKILMQPLRDKNLFQLNDLPLDIEIFPGITHQLTINAYHSIWRNTYETHIVQNINNNEVNLAIQKCWSITNTQIQLSEQYIQLAQLMVDDNYTHDDMPNIRT